MIQVIPGHFVTGWFLFHWAIKILFLYCGGLILSRHIYFTTLQFVQALAKSIVRQAWTIQLTPGFVRLNALAIVLIILGIII
jgi:hypothetical protein